LLLLSSAGLFPRTLASLKEIDAGYHDNPSIRWWCYGMNEQSYELGFANCDWEGARRTP
jgi:hypothetical protein